MRKYILLILFNLQKILFFIFLFFFRLFFIFHNKKDDSWVIGVDEVASCIKNISQAFYSPVKVSLQYHPFYNFKYDYSLKIQNKYFSFIFRSIYGPFLFALLSVKYNNFFYIGGSGFFISEVDGRKFEFNFLKQYNKKIVCYFTGSEIRSFKLMEKIAIENEIDVLTTYQKIINTKLCSRESENLRFMLAQSADNYADLIFNAPMDQKSYIKKDILPFLYFYPDSFFEKNNDKFQNNLIKIVHAPSNPIIKGTPLVRGAIKKLKLEGYNFEYIELIGVSHATVLKELRMAQIVLNEFYSFVPGVFGIEAMASHCALLTSANQNIEYSLPAGSNEAWIVTGYWEIYDNLKLLLDTPSLQKKYADRGYEWAKKNAAISNSREKLHLLISKI